MCVFSKEKKDTQKTNSLTGTFYTTSVHHLSSTVSSLILRTNLFFNKNSRLIRQLVGEFTCNDKKSILEFSIHRKEEFEKEEIQMKRIIMLLGLHLCNGI